METERSDFTIRIFIANDNGAVTIFLQVLGRVVDHFSEFLEKGFQRLRIGKIIISFGKMNDIPVWRMKNHELKIFDLFFFH